MKKSFLSDFKLKITSIVVGALFSVSSSLSFADTVNILGLFPFSGPYADSGKLTDQGARIALEEVNYTINGKKIKYVTRDSETKAYLLYIFSGAILVCGLIWNDKGEVAGVAPVLREGIFQTVSMATTTGFSTSNFSEWPSGLPFILLLSAFVGGCAGSTAGGVKVVRVLLLFLQGLREVKKLVHPSGMFPLKLGGSPVTRRISESVWSFLSAYLIIFLVMVILLLVISDLDFLTSFSAIGACLNNLGPGLGEVASNYSGLEDKVKWVLMFAMLLGRLEIFTLLVLLTPGYWRR